MTKYQIYIVKLPVFFFLSFFLILFRLHCGEEGDKLLHWCLKRKLV